jgi:hypothetical protein
MELIFKLLYNITNFAKRLYSNLRYNLKYEILATLIKKFVIGIISFVIGLFIISISIGISKDEYLLTLSPIVTKATVYDKSYYRNTSGTNLNRNIIIHSIYYKYRVNGDTLNGSGVYSKGEYDSINIGDKIDIVYDKDRVYYSKTLKEYKEIDIYDYGFFMRVFVAIAFFITSFILIGSLFVRKRL